MRISAHTTPPPPRRRYSRALLAVLPALAVAVLAPTTATSATIATGMGHTCAVRVGGTVACWGLNDNGQLGDGTATDSTAPVAVADIDDAVEVAVGHNYSCALRAAGTVSCWGAGRYGTLGDGQSMDAKAPVTVAGFSDAVALSSGSGTACALRSTGAILCWGQGLGPGAATGMGAAFPVPLATVADADDVSVSNDAICAISIRATHCWTFHHDNGDGSAGIANPPEAMSASDDVQQTSGDLWHACDLLGSGQVSCSGYNNQGQLGNGVAGNAYSRMPRGMSLALGITDARSVASLWFSSCALLHDGTVSCWGPIGNGLAANTGNYEDIVGTPERVRGLTGIDQIAGGVFHLCAVDTTGTARCWGSNTYGQIGSGGREGTNCPTAVPGLVVASSARAGVTPIRRNESDKTVPTPAPGTTPLTTVRDPAPCVPTWPVHPSTPSTTPTTPRPVATPALEPGIGASVRLVLPIALKRGNLTLIGFRVPQRWAGKCPKSAKVIVRAAGRSKSKPFRVKRTEAGTCEISGLLSLRGRLASAKRVVVTVRPQGVRSFERSVKAS